ncbi:MAG: pyridoxal 5'-phosphate synthase glutaminase subunit PdxT, partial [Chloroflexi bacterium]|nr:pyridoxal 5'-phosphate synthase glutaminase subunit PdxT [Chloroflexota bacterium]
MVWGSRCAGLTWRRCAPRSSSPHVAGSAVRIGVLALQGAFREHIRALQQIGVEATEVRRAGDLEWLDGVVIPGGESTTIRLLMAEYGLDRALRERIAQGFPVMGTCAGMIVLARIVADDVDDPTGNLDGLSIAVRRNAFGRQVDSFEMDVSAPAIGSQLFHGVFIRAPVVESVDPGVEVLARLHDGRIVGVRQGS